MTYAKTKRATDIILSIPALILTAPILLLAALAVRLRLGRPILFRQSRAGMHGAIFQLYKFRTMNDAVDAEGRMLPDERRLTRLGRLMRKLSIDELPQLWNVLRGEMSLVGPRPLLPAYLPLYSEPQRRRHEVKPGLTGWAQIHGRNAVSWAERFELDGWYVDHCCVWLDFKILTLTFWKVCRCEGINQAGHAGMPEFSGNETASETRL